MSRSQRILLWSAAIVATVSGLTYACLRYLMRSDDPFSAYNHPAQPWALDLHVLVGPLLVFALGWFWGTHIRPKLQRNGSNGRDSGRILIALIAVMTATGYLLQTATAPLWRAMFGWIHGASGTIFFAMLVGHLLVGRRGVSAEHESDEPRTSVDDSEPRRVAVRSREA